MNEKPVFTAKGIDTNNGNLFVSCTLDGKQFLFYMDSEGKYMVSKTQATGKTPKITPQEWSWAKDGFGTSVPSKVRKLNESEIERAKKIVLNIEEDKYFGFTLEQIDARIVVLKKMKESFASKEA